jgi:hypothetical protein
MSPCPPGTHSSSVHGCHHPGQQQQQLHQLTTSKRPCIITRLLAQAAAAPQLRLPHHLPAGTCIAGIIGAVHNIRSGQRTKEAVREHYVAGAGLATVAWFFTMAASLFSGYSVTGWVPAAGQQQWQQQQQQQWQQKCRQPPLVVCAAPATPHAPCCPHHSLPAAVTRHQQSSSGCVTPT